MVEDLVVVVIEPQPTLLLESEWLAADAADAEFLCEAVPAGVTALSHTSHHT